MRAHRLQDWVLGFAADSTPDTLVSMTRMLLGAVPALLTVLPAAALGWWAGQSALWLGIVVFIAAFIGTVVLFHNFDGVISRPLLVRDDQLLLHACEDGLISRFRGLYRHLPASPRCRVCLVPFGGVGRLVGIRPSRKNANFCQSCLEGAPLGVHEARTGVLFADLRGFTPYSEAHGPAASADILSRFYALASDTLSQDDALVELVGDQVMALYLPMFPSVAGNAPDVMVAAAQRLVSAVEGADDILPIGVGLHVGTCSVGNVGKGAEKDFTAVGDVVNTAARLQAQAESGEIVLSAEIHGEAGEALPDTRPVSLTLKGKAEPFPAYVWAPTRPAAAPSPTSAV